MPFPVSISQHNQGLGTDCLCLVFSQCALRLLMVLSCAVGMWWRGGVKDGAVLVDVGAQGTSDG